MKDKIKIIGTGFLTLDIIFNGSDKTPPKFHAGGSFGNVITILSYLGFDTYPISRLADVHITDLLIEDIKAWNVNLDLIFREESGSTPIIIHRVLKDKNGEPKHKFEFKNPSNGKWLPRYKPFLSKKVKQIESQVPSAKVYYFDRVSRSSIDLAKLAKNKGAFIYFEPSSYKDTKQFYECLEVADIIKFSKDQIKNYRHLFPKINSILEIETDGSNGINYRFKSNNWSSLSSYKIKNIKDAAGAGDWCTSGIIKVILNNGTLSDQSESQIKEAINYGQALGAINCLFDGARGSMYNLKFNELNLLVNSLLKNNFHYTPVENRRFVHHLNYSDVEQLLNTI